MFGKKTSCRACAPEKKILQRKIPPPPQVISNGLSLQEQNLIILTTGTERSVNNLAGNISQFNNIHLIQNDRSITLLLYFY